MPVVRSEDGCPPINLEEFYKVHPDQYTVIFVCKYGTAINKARTDVILWFNQR